MTPWKHRPARKRLLNNAKLTCIYTFLFISLNTSDVRSDSAGSWECTDSVSMACKCLKHTAATADAFLDDECPSVTHNAAILLSFMTFYVNLEATLCFGLLTRLLAPDITWFFPQMLDVPGKNDMASKTEAGKGAIVVHK